MEEFTDKNTQNITSVKFFTAYPQWRKDSLWRHKNFVSAQSHFGVTTILGKFKKKDVHCKLCEKKFKAREEKESDVNIATHLVGDAHEDKFDQAYLVTNDSDLIGPVNHVLSKFPLKKLKIISPPFRTHSKELINAGTTHGKILKEHIDNCLLPSEMYDQRGQLKFIRPPEYKPPNSK